ncbi:twin-arginine translocase TatA/TatE family subunit [Pseudaeromonas sharmana]|uniref:Sec-independent protein translocase protein TatA n=1 Tax=Pseudaeromonas sharmana TaxID=328412 RepID=A0ABV8CMR1_9GAMM
MHFSITELLLIAFIVLILFGTKRLRNVGGDLGTALRDFKKALRGDDSGDKPDDKTPPQDKP